MKSFLIIPFLFFFTLNIYCEQKTITYAFGSGDWIPIIYNDNSKNNGYRGLYVEILEEIFVNRLSIGLKYEAFPWKRTQMRVEKGEADFLITVATNDRLKYTVSSSMPLLELYMHIYTYKGHSKLDLINQIKDPNDILTLNLIPVSNLGNGWHKENIDRFGIPTLYVKEDTNIALLLAAKRADIMIEAVIPMNNEIKKLGLSNKILLTDAKFGPVKFYLLMSKKSNNLDLMPMIDKAITDITTDGTLDRITSKYSSLD